MKAKLEFNLPEDQEEFRLANEGQAWANLVFDLDGLLRDSIKYDTEFKGSSKVDHDTLQIVRDEIRILMDESSLNFNL